MKLINRKEIPFYCSITVTRVFYYVISVPDLCGMRPAAGSKVASTRHPAPGTRKMLPGPGSLFPGSFYPAPGTIIPYCSKNSKQQSIDYHIVFTKFAM